MQNIKTFKCIQQCVKSMDSQLNGTSVTVSGNGTDRSKRYVKHVLSNISNENVYVKNTITMITANYPSQKIKLINVYLDALGKSQDASDYIDTTIWQLREIKNYTSQFSGHILNYNTRIRGFLISPLSRLISKEIETTVKSVRNHNNGNRISNKYDAIKPKVEYCKSSLQFEKERLESISNNARMLQKQLESLIVILNKHKTNTEKLEQFRYKLNRMKQNKDRRIKYLTTVSSSIVINLCKIQNISSCLNSAKEKMSIATIKKDIENIYSSIKDINNILSIVKSHFDSLVKVKLEIDCNLVNEIELCMLGIVSGFHAKYCCLSSHITNVFSEQSSPGLTLADDCQLNSVLECRCTPQGGSQTCGSCQDCGGTKGCQCCESIKKLLKTPCSDTNIKEKLNSIKRVTSQLIDGQPGRSGNTCPGSQNQCTHVCQNNQGGQGSNTCDTTLHPEQTTGTTNYCQQTTNIRQLIECTLDEINKCQTSSSKLTDGCKEQVKCTDITASGCQVTSGPQSTTSCPSTTTQDVVSCKDLDKVKLCVDTMINNCNCCQLKELLKGQNLKSWVDVFKWIFIYNFSELFCFYLCFDKSLLDQISCNINKLAYVKSFISNNSIIEYFIKFWIDGIKNGINKIPEQFKNLENIMKSGIRQLECAIEGVFRNPIRCSTKQVSTGLINHHNLGVVKVEKLVMNMYSMSKVIDYKVVVNRLFQCAKKIDQILQLIPNFYGCNCVFSFESSSNNAIILDNKYVHKIIEEMMNKPRDKFYEFLRLHKITRILSLGIDPNHSCLCMILKYILYPSVIKLICVIGVDLETMNTISRKHGRYKTNTDFIQDLVQFFVVCVELLYKVAMYILLKYQYTWVSGHPSYVKCFCIYHQDHKYHLIVNTVLVISSLVENIWSMDPETLRMCIERLSLLYSQLEIYDLNSTSLKAVCCNPVYSLIVNKDCEPKKKEKCCCCWCSTAVNVVMVCISLCIQCKLCNAICTKKKEVCKKVNEFCDVKECKCTCAGQAKGVCCVLNLALSSELSCSSEELQKKLEDCCKSCGVNGCCAKLKEKAKGLCKLLLLGCECNCASTGVAGEEVKVKCVFFNNPWGSSSVGVMLFCKCAQPAAKPCCCLYQLIDKLQQKVKSLFQSEDCKCEQLKTICDQICGQECAPECVCNELKEKLPKICKGGNGNCGGEGCLCKKIKDVIDNSCIKKECKCKDKKGCCRCVCCKLVAQSIRLLTRACRANVLEPYKRITLDLLSSDKYRPEIIRKIVNGINQRTLDRIYLLKNNLLTSTTNVSNNTGLTDVTTVRNWGYDTLYEHSITPDNINEGYPHISNSKPYSRRNSSKMFKLVLSRLFIALIVILMFVYLRISYQHILLVETSDSYVDDNESKIET